MGAADGVSASPDEQGRQQHQGSMESAGIAAALSPLGQASQAESGNRSGRGTRLERASGRCGDVDESSEQSGFNRWRRLKAPSSLVGGRQAKDPSWVGWITELWIGIMRP